MSRHPRLRGKSPSWQPLILALQQLTVERLDELITQLPVGGMPMSRELAGTY
jgi:hypothetical protein